MNYYIQRPDELYHFGVKGMKWGVRKEERRQARERKKQAKADYKELEKDVVRKQENSLRNAYRKEQETIYDIASTINKANKEAYKTGKISKEQYKKNKLAVWNNRNQELKSAEYKMAVGMYDVQRMRRANRLVYVEDIKGKESKAYKKGLDAWNRQIEYYSRGNSSYAVKKEQDGTYSIHRTDYYYY